MPTTSEQGYFRFFNSNLLRREHLFSAEYSVVLYQSNALSGELLAVRVSSCVCFLLLLFFLLLFTNFIISSSLKCITVAETSKNWLLLIQVKKVLRKLLCSCDFLRTKRPLILLMPQWSEFQVITTVIPDETMIFNINTKSNDSRFLCCKFYKTCH